MEYAPLMAPLSPHWKRSPAMEITLLGDRTQSKMICVDFHNLPKLLSRPIQRAGYATQRRILRSVRDPIFAASPDVLNGCASDSTPGAFSADKSRIGLTRPQKAVPCHSFRQEGLSCLVAYCWVLLSPLFHPLTMLGGDPSSIRSCGTLALTTVKWTDARGCWNRGDN